MSTTITFRPDGAAMEALALLTADGTSTSDAIGRSLVETAARRASLELRAEAEALAADSADREEAQQVLRDMESLRAW